MRLVVGILCFVTLIFLTGLLFEAGMKRRTSMLVCPTVMPTTCGSLLK